MSGPPTLTTRELNRATLSRQLLLERHPLSWEEATERLVGLQAQNPHDPYIALWSRLDPFDPDRLSQALEDREAVRTQLMRGTIHLVTAGDHPLLAGVLRSVLVRVFGSTGFAKATAGVDMNELLQLGGRLLEEAPRTRAELVPLLQQRWPEVDGPSLAQAVTYLLPVVQVPPRALWRRRGPARWATAAAWLGAPVRTEGQTDELIRRYLAAFGPASVADARTWSGLSGLAAVFDRLRPELVVFQDQSGRQLFDLPDAPRPGPDVDAPCRLLPEYDNVLLAHADRSRVIGPVLAQGWTGAVMVDGMVAGHWKPEQDKKRLQLAVTLTSPNRAEEVEAEAARLAEFLALPGTEAFVVMNVG